MDKQWDCQRLIQASWCVVIVLHSSRFERLVSRAKFLHMDSWIAWTICRRSLWLTKFAKGVWKIGHKVSGSLMIKEWTWTYNLTNSIVKVLGFSSSPQVLSQICLKWNREIRAFISLKANTWQQSTFSTYIDGSSHCTTRQFVFSHAQDGGGLGRLDNIVVSFDGKWTVNKWLDDWMRWWVSVLEKYVDHFLYTELIIL